MHFYRSKIRTLGAFYVLTCVAPLSYTKYHQFARIIQLIERRIQLVKRPPIRYTVTLFATRRDYSLYGDPLLDTLRHLFATRLNRDSIKEIHIPERLFSENVLFLYKLCVLPHCFEYKKLPSNSIKVRREMWCRWWDSNPHELLAQRILSPPRLPFQHTGILQYLIRIPHSREKSKKKLSAFPGCAVGRKPV